MVKVKLKDSYNNDFLALQSGIVFYKKNNTLGKEANIEDIDVTKTEAKILYEQGTLVSVEKHSKATMANKIKDTIDNTSGQKIVPEAKSVDPVDVVVDNKSKGLKVESIKPIESANKEDPSKTNEDLIKDLK